MSGMAQETYDRAVAAGINPRDRIYRPFWTHLGNALPHDVDHVIELQVVPTAQQGLWGDTFDNYELLDASSNRSAGPALAGNIARERHELGVFYNDHLYWQNCVLHFDEIVPTGSGAGHRWSADEIIRGDHVDAFESGFVPRRPRRR